MKTRTSLLMLLVTLPLLGCRDEPAATQDLPPADSGVEAMADPSEQANARPEIRYYLIADT